MKRLVLILAAASVAAYGNTGTVSATLEDGTFSVSFADHAHETNSLWAVYGPGDSGDGTNGWDHVERLGTVTPETNTWTYAAPEGWGDSVRAIRFVLSSDPFDYAYDYRLDFIRSQKKERICLADFDLLCSYRICVQFSYTGNKGTQAIFASRDGVASNSASPRFNLFLVSDLEVWRFDYNDQNGNNSGTAAPDTRYSVEAGWNGLYVKESLSNPRKRPRRTLATRRQTGFSSWLAAIPPPPQRAATPARLPSRSTARRSTTRRRAATCS